MIQEAHARSESEVQVLEERLRVAMLHSDVPVLDELIAPELVFTSHLGRVVSKQDDLAFHRSGVLKLVRLDPSEQRISLGHGVAIVSVLMHLEGRVGDSAVDERIRYTRVWSLPPDAPSRVIAGHASAVV